jgi:inosine/xanthosine triphosphatase
MIIAVGSLNPVKIESARLAFTRIWPEEEWDARGCAVPSGVSDQPMTDTEACRGARARAVNALKQLDADYAVGLEGGLQQVEGCWFNSGWAAVVDQTGTEGVGTTIRMLVPPALMNIVLAGRELGEACDEVFESSNTKQAQGHFGLMTNNAIDRTTAFRDAVVSALAPFLHPRLMAE